MNILIYDDNNDDLKSTKNCVEVFMLKNEYPFNIIECRSLDEYYNKINDVDIVFLDIELKTSNGIDLGSELRKSNNNICIVLVTNHSQYAIEGYKIKAERYLLKPINQVIFDVEMSSIFINYFSNLQGIKDDKFFKSKILFKDILYIEYIPRKSNVHLINGLIIPTTYPLSYWEEILEHLFFGKPHQSFLVNYRKVKTIGASDIILFDGSKIPITRTFKNTFKSEFFIELQRSL